MECLVSGHFRYHKTNAITLNLKERVLKHNLLRIFFWYIFQCHWPPNIICCLQEANTNFINYFRATNITLFENINSYYSQQNDKWCTGLLNIYTLSIIVYNKECNVKCTCRLCFSWIIQSSCKSGPSLTYRAIQQMWTNFRGLLVNAQIIQCWTVTELIRELFIYYY